MTHFGLRIVRVLAMGLVVAACAGSSGDGTPADDGAAPASSATITIKDFSFGAAIALGVGDTVEVTNTDGAAHTWTSTNGLFDSGNLNRGDSFSFTFSEPGEYAFVCTIHPSMTGTLTVGS